MKGKKLRGLGEETQQSRSQTGVYFFYWLTVRLHRVFAGVSSCD
jgi:hypothetical protein